LRIFLCAVFPRSAQKNAYHRKESTALPQAKNRQLRKFYFVSLAAAFGLHSEKKLWAQQPPASYVPDNQLA
jgi:hypothetical protein